ncbi:MAG: tyrosine--tRNA ligase [Phycisphaerae bacterium]|nr:tyrosine--tRNA ligase [Phycisphaerae bacterium]
MVDFLAELAWRGLLHQTTSALPAHLASGTRTGYCGFDPTSDSLTVGNLLPITLLRRFAAAGHRPIALLGGGTGLIGDPSGKTSERTLQSEAQVAANLAGQRRILERLLEGDGPRGAILVDNADWLRRLGYLEVLRDVGKHFSVNAMIARDSVASRLEGREHGISYTEFSYMVLQAYDFLHLHRRHGCTVQMGGSDQFGNIVSGIDLIRRMHAIEHGEGSGESIAFGVTAPLLTAADGSKIGKSERGAIWLSADRTSPWRFHQFWLNAADADAGRFLRWFTDRTREEIEALEADLAERPQERAAQRTLAADLTDLVHGPTERGRAEAAAAALFAGEMRSLPPATLAEVAGDLPSSELAAASLDAPGLDAIELLLSTGLAKSKREARELLGSGAVSVNGERIEAERRIVRGDVMDSSAGGVILLRRGRKQWHAVRVSAA